jgi:hypothetical protein
VKADGDAGVLAYVLVDFQKEKICFGNLFACFQEKCFVWQIFVKTKEEI